MKTKVKIIGAGSIGNHLAYGCRQQDWEVVLCDIDPAALERTRTEIYPNRYGRWDETIRLAHPDAMSEEDFDVVIIGTPPDTHIKIALDILKQHPPKLLLIEKPLCPPSLADCEQLRSRAESLGVQVLVGYNHTLTPNTRLTEQWLQTGSLGKILTIHAQIREHWQGIFKAHPWISGPEETYLGYTERGGGALGEHSHGLAIWQHFAHLSGHGRIVEVSAMLDMVEERGACYDRLAQLNLRTESGLTGLLVQDVITEPADKQLRLQGENGYIDWFINLKPGVDAVKLQLQGKPEQFQYFEKTRPDDFQPEIRHVGDLLANSGQISPISLQQGMETMLVIAAALRSHATGRVVKIDYDRPYGPDSLQ
ncbi:Gfo/Idh/MocA family protein [Nitrosomonas sp. ANs5]|uniref:Gfo/Idh/MocA family protein n=1 Tax=Nitrosomonas sp. ANs5 TaxID=3423941 RepID=UPI003D349EB0